MRAYRSVLAVLSLGFVVGVWAQALAGEKAPAPSATKPAETSPSPTTQLAADPEDEGTSRTTEPSTTEGAETVKLSLAGDLTFASKYLFQGLDYSDGRSVFQPNVVASLGGFSAVAWGNFQPDLGDVNEIDLSLK